MTPDEVMLDEYGNPIGQLTVNMGRPDALAVVDTSVTDAQTAAAEDAASDLPAGIQPHEVAEFYPGYDDDAKREKARRLMIIEGKTVPEVAEGAGVPERTVLMWVANLKWADARRRDLMARDDLSRLELAETRIRKRNEVFHSQLEQARKIRNRAVEAIEKDETSVKSGAEAWAAAARTEQTILGLSEAGRVASADGKGEEGGGKPAEGGKQPLVMVFQNGGLPPIRRPGK